MMIAFKSYKEGKPTFETSLVEEGLIGSWFSKRNTAEAQTIYSRRGREAIAQRKTICKRRGGDYSGLSSDFNIPSNMSA
jgi:hypothetical protein